jgi:hypothetical protein
VSREDRWNSRADRAADDFTNRPFRTGGKWLAILIGLSLTLAIVFGAVNWVSGWGGEAKRVTGVENVREQNTVILDTYEGMEAAACNALQAEQASSAEGDPTLVESPALAYNAKYRDLAREYDRRMNNLFEAQAVRKLPLPSNLRGLPERSPSLSTIQAEVC